ncbi:La-related protein 6B [Morella rubra]|uniref:La-related protein 6B n=1 Tax=Morella rubra TaxID=262757 RepID=A0A6A1VYX0_9ROSI|nr:La-related protein 6B [Morella rubra]
MAEESAAPEAPDSSQLSQSNSDPSLSRNVSFSRLNAQAPEFVPSPRASSQPPRILAPPPPPPPPFHVPMHGHLPVPPSHVIPVHHHHPPHHAPVQFHPHPHAHPHHQYYGGGGFGGEQEVAVQHDQAQSESDHGPTSSSKTKLSEEATQKILNQVEYYFSDVNLATTDHLMRFIHKDPEGFVPISVVASFKKIKALISSHSQLATALRNSLKLVVSEDGKRVRRQHPLTESVMEELQSRIVVAENLPEDHCHQNLMKVFSAVGSVKTIRTCQPQTSGGGASSASRSGKSENIHFTNKWHAFVEYESIELAEKAVAELNDEGNWRSGLRVRLMLRRTSKPSSVRKKGHDGEANLEEDDTSSSDQLQNEKQLESSYQQSDAPAREHTGEEHIYEKDGGQKRGRNRGRGKGRGRGQYHHNNRGNHVGTPPSNNVVNMDLPTVAKQPPGPRMPDGTRGFAMGRGKPVAVNIA